MIRFLYVCLLRLHPRPFKRRFGEEMLGIFDEAAAHHGAGSLLADAFLSLARQWTLRAPFSERPATAGTAAPVLDGVPVFYVGGNDTPRPGALLHGGVLSLAAFAGVCFFLNHSSYRAGWLIGSHNHSYSHLLEAHSLNAAPTELDTEIKVKPEPEAHRISAYFQLILVLRALDADEDGVISASEIANAPAALRTLDLNHDGKLSAKECGLRWASGSQNNARVEAKLDPRFVQRARLGFMRFHPVLAALDSDHDGEISAAEIDNAPAALKSLDKNGDGMLTEEELLPLRAAGKRLRK